MLEESKSLNIKDYLRKYIFRNKFKETKIETIQIKKNDFNNLKFNKRNDLLLYKNPDKNRFRLVNYGVYYCLTIEMFAITYYCIRIMNSNQKLVKYIFKFIIIFLIFNVHHLKTRFKEIDSIYLIDKTDEIEIKTDNKMRYYFKINELVDLTPSTDPLYVLTSKRSFIKRNKFYYYAMINSNKTYISPLFLSVFQDKKNVQLI